MPDPMTRDELRQWMADHGYSVRRLAAALGVSFGTVQHWRDGRHAVPPWLPVALAGLDKDQEPEG